MPFTLLASRRIFCCWLRTRTVATSRPYAGYRPTTEYFVIKLVTQGLAGQRGVVHGVSWCSNCWRKLLERVGAYGHSAAIYVRQKWQYCKVDNRKGSPYPKKVLGILPTVYRLLRKRLPKTQLLCWLSLNKYKSISTFSFLNDANPVYKILTSPAGTIQ